MQVFPQSQRTAICKEEQGFFFFGFFFGKIRTSHWNTFVLTKINWTETRGCFLGSVPEKERVSQYRSQVFYTYRYPEGKITEKIVYSSEVESAYR